MMDFQIFISSSIRKINWKLIHLRPSVKNFKQKFVFENPKANPELIISISKTKYLLLKFNKCTKESYRNSQKKFRDKMIEF